MANLLAGWKYRVFAVVLCLVYEMDYEISSVSRARLYSSITNLRDAWPLAIYIVISIAAVSLALLALLLGAHWFSAKARKRLSIFLVLYWLPHTVVVGHWCMFDDATAWVQ
jgi:hypothetical protein